MIRYTYTLDELPSVIPAVYQKFAERRIAGLLGTLGAGKTTLVQAVLAHAGVEGVVQSPTFSYVETYTGYGGRTWHHFDLYRITSAEQVREMGFLEYIADPNAYVIIEWPEVVQKLIAPYGAFMCDIRYSTDSKRELLLYDL